MLVEDHRDRWQIGRLVTSEAGAGHALIERELAPAALAGIRIVLDDVHLILGQQLAP